MLKIMGPFWGDPIIRTDYRIFEVYIRVPPSLEFTGRGFPRAKLGGASECES